MGKELAEGRRDLRRARRPGSTREKRAYIYEKVTSALSMPLMDQSKPVPIPCAAKVCVDVGGGDVAQHRKLF